MRISKLSKYAIAGGLLIGFPIAISFSLNRTRGVVTSRSVLRVAYPNTESINRFDPAHLTVTRQVNIIRALYQPLVEFNNEGNITPAVAEDFFWKEGCLHLVIRKDLKTVDGDVVTPRDAYISLMRLMIKQTNTHANLKQFLCPDAELKSLDDICPGLKVEGGELVITPSSPSKKGFILPILASADFSIIPAKALDLHSPELPIREYRSTTGPYYLAQERAGGYFEFHANPAHYHFREKMPQVLQFIPAFGQQALTLFDAEEVDFIPTVDSFKGSELEARAQSTESIHSTLDIKLWVLNFMEPAKKTLNANERRYIGEKIKEVFLKSDLAADLKETAEFFPPFGDGSLSSEQIRHLDEIKKRQVPPHRKVTLAASVARSSIYKELLKDLPFIEVRPVDRPPWTMKYSEMADMYIADTDSGFYEDISLISYNIGNGSFNLPMERANEWIETYMTTEDQAQRLELLRELHFGFLSEAVLVPLGHGPYRALARPPWRIQMSKFYAGTRFWQITTP